MNLKGLRAWKTSLLGEAAGEGLVMMKGYMSTVEGEGGLLDPKTGGGVKKRGLNPTM